MSKPISTNRFTLSPSLARLPATSMHLPTRYDSSSVRYRPESPFRRYAARKPLTARFTEIAERCRFGEYGGTAVS